MGSPMHPSPSHSPSDLRPQLATIAGGISDRCSRGAPNKSQIEDPIPQYTPGLSWLNMYRDVLIVVQRRSRRCSFPEVKCSRKPVTMLS